jgi:hypothetical protein
MGRLEGKTRSLLVTLTKSLILPKNILMNLKEIKKKRPSDEYKTSVQCTSKDKKVKQR